MVKRTTLGIVVAIVLVGSLFAFGFLLGGQIYFKEM